MSEAVQDRGLDALAEEIRFEMEKLDVEWQGMLGRAARVGDLLLEAKATVRHGEWQSWLKAHNIPDRTARKYMRLAAKRPDWAVLGVTTIHAALDVITEPRPDFEIRERDEGARGPFVPEPEPTNSTADTVGHVYMETPEEIAQIIKEVNDPLNKPKLKQPPPAPPRVEPVAHLVEADVEGDVHDLLTKWRTVRGAIHAAYEAEADLRDRATLLDRHDEAIADAKDRTLRAVRNED